MKKQQPKSIGLEVHVNNTGDFKKDKISLEIAIREFKKRVKKSGIMNELREREAYMKPSAYKKFRRNESIKQKKRDERKSLRPRKDLDSAL
jgi:ribosomal protein S21